MKRGSVGAMAVLVVLLVSIGAAQAANGIEGNHKAGASPHHQKQPQPLPAEAALEPEEATLEPVEAAAAPPPGTPSNAEAGAAQEAGCPGRKVRKIDTDHAHVSADPPTTPIEFSVHETSSVLNFGPNRGRRVDYIVLKASEPIPTDIYSTNFEIDTVEPMRRIGEASLESVQLPPPTYTPPHFFNHRKEVGFNFCVASGENDPGTYTGQYELIGPGAIETATLTQTAQLKEGESTFFIWLGAVLVLAGVLLVLNQIILPETPKGKALTASIVFIVIALAAAASAMLTAWSQSPTWGENIPIAVAALITTAFGAAGVGSTLSTVASHIKDNKKDT
jgi:hypothetical protein